MFKLGLSSIAVCVFVAAAVRADDKDDAKAILDKAIKAHGGEEKLAKPRAMTMKVKGKFYGFNEEGIEYKMELSATPTKRRFDLDSGAGDASFKFSSVYNGEKGWRKINDDVADLTKEEIEEVKHDLYIDRVTTLAPLKDKEFKLSALGETKIGKKAAVGIKIECKGHRDVNLFFDKDTGLLIKSESKVIDMGEEKNQETIFSDHKDIEGRKVPMKVVINRDGKLFVEGETTEYKFHDKLDDNVFAKP
jgi:hypothetical protein